MERPKQLCVIWALIAIVFSIFIAQLYLAMAPAWQEHIWSSTALCSLKYASAEESALKCSELAHGTLGLDGDSARLVVFVWAPLLGIALLAIWQRNWPFREHAPQTGYFDPQTLVAGKASSWHAFKRQVRSALQYQLPPRDLWASAFADGFSVIDFLVVSIYGSLCICWLYFGYTSKWDVLQEILRDTGTRRNGSYFCDVCNAIGYSTAWAALYTMILLFLPIPRSSFLHYLFNSDFASIIKYHRWLGQAWLTLSLCHGGAFYISWLSDKRFGQEVFAWQTTDVNYLAGSLAFFPFLGVLWITTIPAFRRKFFKVFYASHIFGFLGGVLFIQIHYPSTIYFLSPGLIFYLLDICHRLAQRRVVSGVQCSYVSSDKTFVTLKLRFNKATKVTAGQFIFVNLPSVAYFQWHPISIAAVTPGADGLSQNVTLHIKTFGDWSKGVVEKVLQEGTTAVRVEGPYGGSASSPQWARHDHTIMLAGGIGITPLLGMLTEMNATHEAFKAAAEQQELSSVEKPHPFSATLVWAFKRKEELSLMNEDLFAVARMPNSWLKLLLYQTKKHDTYADFVDGMQSRMSVTPCDRETPPCLPPYILGDAHYMLAHVLAFVGAFFSVLCVSGWNQEGQRTGVNDGAGQAVWAFGPLLLLGLVVGALGLPALLIFPLQILRFRKHVKACEEQHKQAMQKQASAFQDGYGNNLGFGIMDGRRSASLSSDSLRSSESSAVSGPQKPLRLHWSNDSLSSTMSGFYSMDLEMGGECTVQSGRPNLTALVQGELNDVPSECSVNIVTAGPLGMVLESRQAAYRAARLLAKESKRKLPEISFTNHTFSL